jgi:starch phosphorylase
MKFTMNGALTIGTLDGANVEIREQVGAENFFLFGHSTDEVARLWRRGYRPLDHYEANPELREVIDLIRGGYFSRGDTELFRPLVDRLLYDDPYLALADYESYADCQRTVAGHYADGDGWTRMSIINSARSALFSSDRTIREYCRDIWRVSPVPIRLVSEDEVEVDFMQ